MDTLYILIRTSNRPLGFKSLMESVKKLTWPNIVTIVHTDDPRDTYVEGDIILKGELHGPYMGTAPYNLYNNRLLETIKSPGWVHFIDDDDMYASPDVFEKLLNGSKNNIQVGKVTRWNNQIFPKKWGHQTSFQTECFSIWSDHAKKYKWWADKGGDHYYSRQVTRDLKCEWHDVMIAVAQNGKGHGSRIDIDNNEKSNLDNIKDDEMVFVKLFDRHRTRAGGTLEGMKYGEARILERLNYGRVTFKGVSEYDSRKQTA